MGLKKVEKLNDTYIQMLFFTYPSKGTGSIPNLVDHLKDHEDRLDTSLIHENKTITTETSAAYVRRKSTYTKQEHIYAVHE